MLARLVTSVIGIVCLVASLSAAVATPPAAAASYLTAEEEQMAGMVNDYRAKHGLAPLEVHAAYRDVARAHSSRMADTNDLHHNPNLAADADRAVPGWRLLGENVGTGASTESVQQGFIDSPRHRDNILTAEYTVLAVGAVRADNGRLYFTQNFADQAAPPAPDPTPQPAPDPTPEPAPVEPAPVPEPTDPSPATSETDTEPTPTPAGDAEAADATDGDEEPEGFFARLVAAVVDAFSSLLRS